MSSDGATIGLPLAGERRLRVESRICFASATASRLSGTWTAIWSPSKSAVKAVEGGRAVEQHRAVLDDLIEDIPDLRASPFDDPLGALDVVREALGDERV